MTLTKGNTRFRMKLVLVVAISVTLAFAMDTVARAALGPVVLSQVKDSDPGSGDGNPLSGGNGAQIAGGVDLDGVLIYDANDGFSGAGHGQELWRSDGTDAGTYLLKDISAGAPNFSSSPSSYAELNGEVYFSALESGVVGTELWKTDGTTAGTEMVKDINPVFTESGAPTGLTNVNGTLFFLANSDGVNGQELWMSDGTTAGTVQVRDIQSTLANTAYNLTAVGNRLFFTFNDGVNGKELWTSDGTSLGTKMVENIGPGAVHGLPNPTTPQIPDDYFDFEGVLYFRANDGVNGMELWRSDGTEAGTFMVKDITGGSGGGLEFGGDFEELNGELLFSWNFGLYKTDGTGSGTVSIPLPEATNSPQQLTKAGGNVFFEGTLGRLYKTNGTGPGTEVVLDLANDAPIHRLTAFDGNIYMAFDDGTHGTELWRSDGTVLGIERRTDINPGAGSSLINEMTVVGDRLFFRGDDDSATGVELWSEHADRTPPQTTILSGPAEGETIETDSTSFTFTSDDPAATFTCVIDGGTPESCDAGTIAYSGLSEGPHSFQVTATDAAPFSNVEQTPATRNFAFGIPVVDPPVVDPPVTDPPVSDTDAPKLRLRGSKKQRSPKRIVVKATCLDEACSLKATGRIKVKILKANGKVKKTRSLKLKRAKASAAAGGTVKLKLKLSKKAKKLVRKVLKKKTSKARIKVFATDSAGNTRSRGRTVKVIGKKRKRG
ncbi:MAG: ELWxxDGT repeat protein [Solirubrobacterales bacterium]